MHNINQNRLSSQRRKGDSVTVGVVSFPSHGVAQVPTHAGQRYVGEKQELDRPMASLIPLIRSSSCLLSWIRRPLFLSSFGGGYFSYPGL
jgi:hypothetical protein